MGSLALFHSKILQELKFMISIYIYKLFKHRESISVQQHAFSKLSRMLLMQNVNNDVSMNQLIWY